MPWFASLLRPELAELSPYTPHAGAFPIRLDANEAPPLLSLEARSRLAEIATTTAFERYPDVAALELRAALASRCDVGPEEILVGAGSDELIALLLTALGRPREHADAPVMLCMTPTFGMYRMSARVRGQRVLEVPLDADWDLAPEALRTALRVGEPSVIFVSSPNNPTSNLVCRDRLRALIESARESLVVIDEAYVDYSDRDQLELYRQYENVAVLRTLSKVGFAALRVGWLIARAELVRELDKVRPPYNVPTLSQKLATAVVTELADELRNSTATVVRERVRISAELARLDGVEVVPSQANFLWVRAPVPAEQVFSGLCQRGILVRSFHARGGRLAHNVRVTIGTADENAAFLAAYRALL